MAEEMQWASHGTIKATKLHNEPIALRIVAPTEPCIRAYITIGGVYSSKLQSLPSEEEDDTNSPGWGYTTMPPGRAWRPHRPGTVASYGESPSGDCPS